MAQAEPLPKNNGQYGETGKIATNGKEGEVVEGKIATNGKEGEVNEGKIAANGKEEEVNEGKIATNGKEGEVDEGKIAANGKEEEVNEGKIATNGKEGEVDEELEAQVTRVEANGNSQYPHAQGQNDEENGDGKPQHAKGDKVQKDEENGDGKPPHAKGDKDQKDEENGDGKPAHAKGDKDKKDEENGDGKPPHAKADEGKKDEENGDEDIVPGYIRIERKVAGFITSIRDGFLMWIKAILSSLYILFSFMMTPIYAAFHLLVKIWNQHGYLISKILLGVLTVLLVSLMARILILLFLVQDKAEDFQTFVKEKDRKFEKIMDAQNYHVKDLYDAQDDLKEHLEAVVKKSSEDLTSHDGALVEIKNSIFEVKTEFEEFMVKSQMHIMELQKESQKTQKGMVSMQEGMNKEMGNIRGDVNAVRKEYSRMKSSLDSIDFNIEKMKQCGFFARLFGMC